MFATRVGRIASPFIIAAAALLVVAATTKKPSSANNTAAARVERGRYLVSIMGCNDCHTPLKMGAHGPEPDMTLMLSGHPEKMKMPPVQGLNGAWMWAGAATNTAFAGPWGVSYAANLTPDPETGMGSAWTEARFISAIRNGKHIGEGRTIMPPMPWQSFRNASDGDLKAMYAYLKSLKPIRNAVPDYQPPAAAPAR